MIYRFLLIVSLVRLVNPVIAQEKAYNLSPYTIPYAGATYFDGKIYCGVYKQTKSEVLDSITSSILVFDQQGSLENQMLIDSVPSLPLVTATFLQRVGSDEELSIGLQTDSGNLSQVSETEFRRLDSNFNTLSSLKLSEDSGVFTTLLAIYHRDTLVLAGSFYDYYPHPTIKVFKGGQLVKSIRYDQSGSGGFISGVYFNGQYVLGYKGNDNEYLAVFSGDFQKDTVYKRSDSPDWRSREFFDFIPSSDSNYLYALGFYQAQYFTVMKFDKSMQRVRIDTLISEWNYRNPSPAYINHTIRSLRNPSSYRSPDSIFMVGGMSFSNGANWLLGDSVGAPLQVVLTDTAGNFHWSRTVGDGDSAYYYAWTVVATDDGGALIFSSKYDHTHSIEPHYLLSVIKIQGNGEVISEKEYSLARGKALTLFPNPVAARVNFQLLSDKQAVAFRIFNQNASLVASGGIKGELDFIKVNDLPTGIYILEITDVEGQKYLGRFLKS